MQDDNFMLQKVVNAHQRVIAWQPFNSHKDLFLRRTDK
jgi:hypothetical protein